MDHIWDVSELPPRSRGWTLEDALGLVVTGASPALAGMDPRTDSRPEPRGGFPRARGDGPFHAASPFCLILLPPRSRGWTLRVGAADRDVGASPALAGMDLTRTARSRWRISFPRARGDGPDFSVMVDFRLKLPPRSRGWTRRWPVLLSAADASPALAGMDPASGISRVA